MPKAPFDSCMVQWGKQDIHSMTKNHKLLFWIGLGLFLIPEIFLIGGLSGWLSIDWLPLLNLPGVWMQHTIVILTLIALEGAGLALLLYVNRQCTYHPIIIKHFVSVLLSFLILWILLTLYVGYAFAYKVSFP